MATRDRVKRTVGEQLPWVTRDAGRDGAPDTWSRAAGATAARCRARRRRVRRAPDRSRAPRLSFTAPITARRRVAFADLPFADILRTKRAIGSTVTDVVIAVCTGALRTWLDDRDELPTSPLVAMVPVMVAGPAGTRDGAHLSGLVVPLATNVTDPVDRLRRTSEALRFAKDRHDAVPASVIQDMALFAPPAVAALAGRLVGALPLRTLASPTTNLAITNVPGPRHEVLLAGRPLEGTYPLLAINETSPLHIGLQSSPGVVHVGAVACRDSLPDLAALVNLLPVELSRLRAAVAG